MDIAWRIIATLGLVALNGYFVAAEFAAVGARQSRLEAMAKVSLVGRFSLRIKKQIDLYLSTCQLGITLASLGLGAVTEPALAAILNPLLHALGIPEHNIHGVALAVGLTIATALHVVVGENAPKNYAIFHADRILPIVAVPLVVFTYVFFPAIWVLNSASNLVLKIAGIRTGSEAHATPHSPEELRQIVRDAGTSGTLESAQTKLLTNAFEFGERRVRQIMTPRTKMDFLLTDRPVKDVLRAAQTSGYSRLPLCEKDLDHVIGVVHLKDVLTALKLVPGKLRILDARTPDGNVVAIPEGKPGSAVHVIGSGHIDLREIKHDVLFVPELTPVPQLLRQFQQSKLHMAVVVDEYGSTQGVVTIEDVLEELVGEIDDEFDAARADLQRDGDAWLVSGLLPLHELRNKLAILDLNGRGVDTVGGFITQSLGRFPRSGDVVPIGTGFEARVMGVQRRAVTQARVGPREGNVAAAKP